MDKKVTQLRLVEKSTYRGRAIAIKQYWDPKYITNCTIENISPPGTTKRFLHIVAIGQRASSPEIDS